MAICKCYSKLVANSSNFLKSHSCVFVRSACTPLMVRLKGGPSCFILKMLHFCMNQIVRIYVKTPPHKIVIFHNIKDTLRERKLM